MTPLPPSPWITASAEVPAEAAVAIPSSAARDSATAATLSNAEPANRSTAHKATANVGDDRESMEARSMMGIVTEDRASTKYEGFLNYVGAPREVVQCFETFSEYTRRHSLPKVSPPLPRNRALVPEWIARSAMHPAARAAGWARGFDPQAYFERIEPRPTFLDNPTLAYDGKPAPRETLLKLLAELAGA